MTAWALRRILEALVIILVGMLVLVSLIHLMPGDPLNAIIGERTLNPETIALLREQWGVNRSLPVVLWQFMTGLFHADLGISYGYQRPVLALLAERLGPTLLLGGLTLLVTFTLGICLGLWSALKPESLRAQLVGAITLISYALPSFVIGLVLVWIFAVNLQWLPAGGFGNPLLPLEAPVGTVFLDRVRHLILPLTTMVLATVAVPIRQQRSAALAVKEAPWVIAARARGTRPSRVIWKHIWRPALTPVITLLGLWLPLLVSGSVFVEYVFGWPGIGALIAEATAARDVPLVVGAGVLMVAMVQIGSLLADLLYKFATPASRPS